jgi:hypothetical protein
LFRVAQNHALSILTYGLGQWWSKQKLGNNRLLKWSASDYLAGMSTVQEIETAISKLSRTEIERIRAWIDDFLEDQLELTDEVKAKLDQSHREIAEGHYTTRQPK